MVNGGVDVGGQTSVSEVQDNVHWFTALSDDALLYNLSVDLSTSEHLARTSAMSAAGIVDPELASRRSLMSRTSRSARRAAARASGSALAVDVCVGML